MKKILALVCTLSLLAAMVSCGHKHLFSADWTSDSECHWHACGKKKKCEERSDSAKHDFVLETGSADVYKCSVCGYKKTGSDYDSDFTGYKVSGAEEWDSLVGALSFTNFTLEIKFIEPGFEQIKKLTFTDYGAHFYEDEWTEYYLMKSGNVWEGYSKNGDKFASNTDGSEVQAFHDTLKSQFSISITLVGNFDKFTYNAQDGTYTCHDTLIATAYGDDMYCFNIVLTLTKNGVASISAEYNFGTEEECEYFFSYYDIGTSKVEIPQSVKDDANRTEN